MITIPRDDVNDRVLIRRELVNFGYLGKDTAKNIYWVKRNIGSTIVELMTSYLRINRFNKVNLTEKNKQRWHL
jgi:hypothetical protein